MNRVLVTDGLWRKSLSVVRNLGRYGLDVSVTGDSLFTTSFFSKYCKKKILLPNAEENKDGFLKGLLKELQTTKYDALFPMEDKTLAVLVERRREIEKYTRLPIAGNESLEIAGDKSATLKIAQGLGIPIPTTYSPNQLAEVTDISRKICYPAVIKPRKSSGARGLRYVNSAEELIREYSLIHAKYELPIIQERLPQAGRGVGVGLLFGKQSTPLAGFAYQRLREYPVGGGPSTLRESTNDPKLIEMAIALLQALDWYGVAMVEFKIDPRDGQPKLMEINPRFWGSIELPIVSGVSFPVLLYKMAMGESFEPVFEYKTGVKCRWLVPGDMLHFLSNPQRFSMNPSFFDFFAKDTRYDEFSSDDVGGSLGTILCVGFHALRPKMWKVAINR